MKICFTNYDNKGCCEQCEWDPTPFFDGRICRKDDLRRFHSFTAKDEARMAELERGIQKLEFESRRSKINRPEENHEEDISQGFPDGIPESEQTLRKLREELIDLSVKCQCTSSMVEYETTLYDGQVKVQMAFGCYLGILGENGEFLDLEGDIDCIHKILPLIKLAAPCWLCERPRTVAEAQQLPNGLCSKC